MTGNCVIFKIGEVYEFFYHGKRRIAKIRSLDMNISDQGYCLNNTLKVNTMTLDGYRTFFDKGMVNVRRVGKLKRAILWLKGVRL